MMKTCEHCKVEYDDVYHTTICPHAWFMPGPGFDGPRDCSCNLPHGHILKTDPDVWRAIESGVKAAEFRRFDRPFRVGDRLLLVLGDRFPQRGENVTILVRQISHIQPGGSFGIPDGYALLSFDGPNAIDKRVRRYVGILEDAARARDGSKEAAVLEMCAAELMSCLENEDRPLPPASRFYE